MESGWAEKGERWREELAVLDKMLARSRNRAALHRALQKEFSESPLRFFKTIILSLRLSAGFE
ncbi:MAG: hypothetical protein ACOYOU_13980 [Kiritimatiellia bacterium]